MPPPPCHDVHPADTMLALALVMFVVASIDDLRRRRVDNRWWIPFLGGALAADVLLLLEHGFTGREAILLGLSVACCGLFYGMWWFGLFGGADAKGLMVLALMVPVPPAAPSTVFALDALSNGLILALVLPLLFGLWNLLHGRIAFPAMLLGFPLDLDAARSRMVWPLQRVDGDGVRWAYRRRLVDEDDPWSGLQAAGVERPWVTPMVPFMVPLAGGVVVAALWGNLMVRALGGWMAW